MVTRKLVLYMIAAMAFAIVLLSCNRKVTSRVVSYNTDSIIIDCYENGVVTIYRPEDCKNKINIKYSGFSGVVLGYLVFDRNGEINITKIEGKLTVEGSLVKINVDENLDEQIDNQQEFNKKNQGRMYSFSNYASNDSIINHKNLRMSNVIYN